MAGEVAVNIEDIKLAVVSKPPNSFIVTHDFEAAANRCRAKVKVIAAHCRSQNRRFRDIEFDVDFDRDRTLHSVDRYTAYSPSGCLRVSQIFEKPVFIAGDQGPSCEVLGWGADDGEFLSALGTAATSSLLERICVVRDEAVGVYGFIFWSDDGWKEVVIDDLLYTCIPRWEELGRRSQAIWQDSPEKYQRHARKGGRSLFFARSVNENETWVALLEKAYAKMCGDYASVYRKDSAQVVEQLTGSVAMTFGVKDILDTDEFWEKVLLPVGQSHLVSVYIESAPPGGESYQSTLGLVAAEPFYVTKALSVAGRRFLIMRNPWGSKSNEWTGRWGTGSSEWTTEWLNRVIAGEFDAFRFGQEGRFIMEYCDFLETWDCLTSFRLFDSSWAMSQLWLQVDLGSYPRAWDYGDVSYTIHVDKPTRAIISLKSHYVEERSEGLSAPFYHKLDFVIFRAGELEPLYFSLYNDAGSHYGVTVEIDCLEAGDYVLHPRIDRERRFLKPPPNLKGQNDPSPPPMPLGMLPNYGSRPPSPTVPGKSKDPVTGRKFAHTRAAMLQTQAIACNFNNLQGEINARHMPLPPGSFGGEDLTSMEFRIFGDLIKRKKAKKAAWEIPASSSPGLGLSLGIKADSKPECAETGSSTAVSSTVHGMQESSVRDDSSDGDDFEDALENLEVPVEDIPSCDHGKHYDTIKQRRKPKLPPLMFLPDFEIEIPSRSPSPSSSTVTAGSPGSPAGSPRSPLSPLVPCPGLGPMCSLEGGVGKPPLSVPPAPPLHEGYLCRGCNGPIIGSRFKCMSSVSCIFYSLCSRCHDHGAHTKGHQFLEIPTPEDADLLFNPSEDLLPGNEVILGLRVYTDSTVEAKIEGQLRHGDLIRRGLRREVLI